MKITAVRDGVVRETFPKCIDFLYGDKYNPIFDSLNARKASKQELSSHFIMSKNVAISNYVLGGLWNGPYLSLGSLRLTPQPLNRKSA